MFLRNGAGGNRPYKPANTRGIAEKANERTTPTFNIGTFAKLAGKQG
jgi:hypothetical protein